MSKDRTLNLQMDIPTELLRDIERIGEKEDRSRNGQLLWLLREGVKRYNKRRIHV